jgi:predicted nucleic acid-binding protein
VNTIDLDASVAAKTALLARYAKGEIRFIVPDLFWPEIGNILWKATRQNRCTKESAGKAISSLTARKVPTISSEQLLPDAFAIATAFDRLAARLPVKWLGAF